MSPAGEKRTIIQRFGRHINRGQVSYLRAGHLDVIETQRSGAGFVDLGSGRRMLDCFTSAGCFNIGRGNPTVVQAALEASQATDMGEPGVDTSLRQAFRHRLMELAPGEPGGVLHAAGGGDAVDLAIKLARAATGRAGIVATVMAYHGHTGFALSANGKPHYRDYAEPLMPGFTFVPFNDLEALRRVVDHNTAAILIEPVQGEAGIYPADDEFMRGMRRLADETGALLVVDEVQTGLGRTGRLFACEHSGVVPDIMVLAKSLGGGLYPNAAVIYWPRPEIDGYLAAHPDFHPTTGGGDLACAVSLAVLNTIVEQELSERAHVLGKRLLAALRELAEQHPGIIREVRGVGLMIGLEYIHEFLGPMMSDALARHGVFAAYSGNAPQTMRFMPPLTIQDEEVDRLIDAVKAAVTDMQMLLPIALPAARIPALKALLNDERVQVGLFGALRTVEEVVSRLPLNWLRRDKS